MDTLFIFGIQGWIGIAIGLIFLILKLLWNRKMKAVKNPFKVKENFFKRALETDKTKRKLVLKRSFRPNEVPKDLDAIVIGSGIGGLTCAGLLSRCGKTVLVLEQHDRAGGCTHTYKSKGFEFDIGIHYVGNIEEGSMNRCLIDLITDHQLNWVEIDKNFDAIVLNKPNFPIKTFSYSKGIKEFKSQLLIEFPAEEKAIEKFFCLLKSCVFASTLFTLSKALPKVIIKFFVGLQLHKIFFRSYINLTEVSLKQVIDSLTANPDLKMILSYPFGDYGATPIESSFFMHGMLINHMYRKGGFYPVGGASEIAYQIIPGILRGGGAVFNNAFVKEILIENGRACGVKVKMINGSIHTVKAKTVISAAGIYNTFTKMLPSSVVDKFQVFKNISCIQPGITCLQVMIGLDGSQSELKLPKKNFWIFTSADPGQDLHDYLAMSREEAANSSIPLLFVSFPSAKDPTWETKYPNKSTCIIVTMSNLAWFDEWQDSGTKKHGSIYDDLKSTFVNQAWKQVLQKFPFLADKVDLIEGGSPLTHINYLNSVHGEIYGIHHNKERFYLKQSINLRPETSIPNLFLSGQDIFTCGFMGGALSGLLTASKVVNRFLLLDWIEAVKDERKKK